MTQELVKELFEYREDGHLYWKVKKSRKTNVGQIAGGFSTDGYRYIRVDGKLYAEHRLIWLYHNCSFPKNEIDHINLIKHDNRIENLRDATHTDNMKNQYKVKKITTSIFKGVHLDKRNQKWISQITLNKKAKHLGCFFEESAAAQAYNEAAIKHFGEFALTNKI